MFVVFVCLFSLTAIRDGTNCGGKVWLAWLNCLTPSCLGRGNCAAQDPRRWRKRGTIQYPNARMTPALKIGGDEGFEERGEASGIKLRSFCLPAKRVIARPKQFKNGRASTVRLPYVTLSVNFANAYIHFVCKIYVI